MSQRIFDLDVASGTASILREVGEDCRRVISELLSSTAAIAWKSITGRVLLDRAFASILDKASGGVLAVPLICRRSEVNCAMMSRCRACHGECLLGRVWRA